MDGLEAVLAQSVLVENTLPEGSNWDGKSGLLVDEKTFNELLGGRADAPRHRNRKPPRSSGACMKQLLRCCAAGSWPRGAPGAGVGADLAPMQTGLDYHSFANVEQFRVTRLELDLRVDFTNKVLFGTVALEIKRLDPRATRIGARHARARHSRRRGEGGHVLGATAKSQTTWVSRPFHFDRADPILGSPLVIELPPSKKTTRIDQDRIRYRADVRRFSGSTPKQTTGRHQPFMYTLSEPIGARSWIPLQDTPQVRITYARTSTLRRISSPS